MDKKRKRKRSTKVHHEKVAVGNFVAKEAVL